MIRTLLIIAGAALVLSLATLTGAAALGGADLREHGWSWTVTEKDGDRIHFQRGSGDDDADRGPSVTRNLPWSGGASLIIDGALNVEYVQGAEAGVVITGPQAVVERVRLDGARLSLDEGDERIVFGWDSGHFRARSDYDDLRVVITAPSVATFQLNGSQRLSITGYDQPSIAISVSGSGEVEATGETQVLNLTVDGSGEADMRGLATRDAVVSINGSGDALVAPTGRADLNISGSGDIDVVTRPATVNQNISGSGDVGLRG